MTNIESNAAALARVQAVADRWESVLDEIKTARDPRWLLDPGVMSLEACLRELRRALRQGHTADDDKRVEWGIKWSFLAEPQPYPDEESARRLVQSYIDNPDALDDDPMPVAVKRTVTTSPWTSIE